MRANGQVVLLIVSSLMAAPSGAAQRVAPQPAPLPSDAMHLLVAATDAPGKRLHAHLVVPAAPGPLTLYYPKWIPGEHGPTGPIVNLAGLKFRAGGKTLRWRRDPIDMYAFHLDVPSGATAGEADLEFLA